jgi:hypothetical protein
VAHVEGGTHLRVFNNRVLGKTFGSKRDEVTEECIQLHNELNELYCSPSIVLVIKWRMRWAGHVAHVGERCIQVLGGET